MFYFPIRSIKFRIKIIKCVSGTSWQGFPSSWLTLYGLPPTQVHTLCVYVRSFPLVYTLSSHFFHGWVIRLLLGIGLSLTFIHLLEMNGIPFWVHQQIKMALKVYQRRSKMSLCLYPLITASLSSVGNTFYLPVNHWWWCLKWATAVKDCI